MPTGIWEHVSSRLSTARWLILLPLFDIGSTLAIQSWDSWFTCNDGFKHYMKQTGIRDPMVGEVTAVRVVCLRPGCGWEHTGNQMTAFIAEYRHWQSHVPDKKQQKAKRMHQAVDGPHYAAVEGQPNPGVVPSQGSPTQLPFLFLNVGQGLTLLVGENNGVCHLSLIEKFGDWLSTDQKSLFSSQVSGPPCQKLWEAVKKDNEARLGK